MNDQIIEKYIKLRDKKAQLKADYEAKTEQINAMLEKIELQLMTHMREQGLKAMPTAAGTAYMQTRTSASVADWDGLLRFIRENEAWTMLEKRVAKGAVEEWRTAHEGDMPPGVNWYETVVVNVKRS